MSTGLAAMLASLYSSRLDLYQGAQRTKDVDSNTTTATIVPMPHVSFGPNLCFGYWNNNQGKPEYIESRLAKKALFLDQYVLLPHHHMQYCMLAQHSQYKNDSSCLPLVSIYSCFLFFAVFRDLDEMRQEAAKCGISILPDMPPLEVICSLSKKKSTIGTRMFEYVFVYYSKLG